MTTISSTKKPYRVVRASGNGRVSVLSHHATRSEAKSAMGRVSGTVVAVTNPSGRIIATNLKRSYG